MPATLRLLHFNPAEAFRDDLASGINNRLVFYRAIAVDAADDCGRTMLSHAAEAGDFEAVRILLDRGADPDTPDRNGLTPLMHLAQGPKNWREHPDAVEKTAALLLSSGAKANAKDSSGRTAAFFALEQMLHPFFTALARCGVKASGPIDSTGFTLLHALCSNLHRFTDLPHAEALTAETDALAIAMILVRHLGVNPNAKSAIGKTAREIAAANGSRLVAPWLVYGDEAFLENDESAPLKLATGGATAAEAAAMRDVGKIKALIALGQARDEPASEGDLAGLTPLSAAAHAMAPEVMSLLIDAGASPTARVNGKARHGLETDGTSAMRLLLWAPQYPLSIPGNLSVGDWAKALRIMLQAPEAANAPVDAEGLTPLLTLAHNIGRGWRAGEENWAHLATSILLEKGADPNARMSAKGVDRPFLKIPGSITALGLLALNGSQDAEGMARLLLKGGADPNLADKSGTTPIMAAAGLSSPAQAEAFTELLLDAGADASIMDAQGRTALDIAAATGNDGVVEKLLSAIAKCEAAEKSKSFREKEAFNTGREPEALKRSSCEEGCPTFNTSASIPAKRDKPPMGSFFDRIRSKHSSGITPLKAIGDPESKAKTTCARMEPQTDSQTRTGWSDFFDRVRRRSPQPATGATNGDEGNRSSLHAMKRQCASDPFDPVRGMTDFLSRALKPLTRGPLELRMMALGLYSEGGDEDPDILARRTADLLISLDAAVEMDWKTDGEEFCGQLEGLSNFALIRSAGFNNVPIDIHPDDEVPDFARKFDAVSTHWGLSLRIAALGLDCDSYIFLLLDSLSFIPARQAAERAGLTLLASSDLR